MLNVIETLMGLLAAVAALAFLSRKVPLPYPVLLVLGGLVLALIPGLPRVALNPQMVFLCFLPPLLYPAALFTPWRDFRANLRPILLLAVGLVLFTTAAVGFLVHYYIPEFPLAAGFVLGAIISPPDAIAATAIAERLRVPRRIVTILEGESLVNDATALVAFRFAVAIGLAVGYLTTLIQKRIDDAPIEITLSLLTPFTAYLPAEQFGVSGVLAVVTTGLYHGWRIPTTTSASTRLQAGPVWEMIEFLLNGFIFLLIGLQLPEVLRRLAGRSLWELFRDAGLISAAVIIIRVLWVFPATYVPRLIFKSIRERDPYPSWKSVTVVAWTGMRGVVSLAAALALPLTTESGAAFPGRDLILFLTFVVILATLVVQGLSLPLVIRGLGIEDDRIAEREEREARLKANQAALAKLNDLAASDSDANLLQRLRGEYEERIGQLEELEASDNPASVRGLFSEEYERISREALAVERQTILKLRDDLIINDEVLRRIQHDIDLAEARLGAQD